MPSRFLIFEGLKQVINLVGLIILLCSVRLVPIMSCSEVMYQAYYPYLYQRPGVSPSSHPVPRTGPFSSPFTTPHHHHQYERFNVQRLPEAAHLNQPSTSSVAFNDHTIYLHAQQHTPNININNNNNSNNNNNNLVINNNHNISSANSVSSTGCLSPTSPIRIKEDECSLPGRSSTEVTNQPIEDVDENEDMKPPTAQYLNNNCIIFTNYNGDSSNIVNEHFSRSLDNKSLGQSKDVNAPMTQRNFPASFWNSEYHAICNINPATTNSATLSIPTNHPLPTSSTSVNNLQTNSHHSDLYADHYHPPDSWYHQYSTHQRAVHDYHHHHNMATSQYNGFLFQNPRLHHHLNSHGPCKTVDWQHHPPLEPPYTTYPTMTGLEAQESSKDLYWF